MLIEKVVLLAVFIFRLKLKLWASLPKGLREPDLVEAFQSEHAVMRA